MKRENYNALIRPALKGDVNAVREEARKIYYNTPATYNEYEGKYYDGRDALLTILGVVHSNRYHGELTHEVEAVIEEALKPWT